VNLNNIKAIDGKLIKKGRIRTKKELAWRKLLTGQYLKNQLIFELFELFLNFNSL
jgi:hypothetical protein